jgi:shikimate kinase
VAILSSCASSEAPAVRSKLVLTGFMATGKSTVAGELAARLGWRLVDTDREICARAGKSVAQIFADQGEKAFRALEREVVAEAAADPRPAVIAAGGGALTDESNLRALSAATLIVCLCARPEIIAQRVERSQEVRPKLLEGGKPLDVRIGELMAERESTYACASFTLDVSELSVEEAADRILSFLRKTRAGRCELSA